MLERSFDKRAVQALKAAAGRDLIVGGPNLAAQALAAGLVDEVRLFVWPVVLRGRNPHWQPRPALTLNFSTSSESVAVWCICATAFGERGDLPSRHGRTRTSVTFAGGAVSCSGPRADRRTWPASGAWRKGRSAGDEYRVERVEHVIVVTQQIAGFTCFALERNRIAHSRRRVRVTPPYIWVG